jgi:Cu(I)/Ag(I) efflux system protein CusF
MTSHLRKFFSIFAILSAFFLLSAVAFAQHHHGGSNDAPAPRQIYSTDGVVVAIDAAKSAIVVKHGPIPAVNWDAMTMGFIVLDPSLLEGLKVDDKVVIDILFEGSNYGIVDLEVID